MKSSKTNLISTRYREFPEGWTPMEIPGGG
jgi:hypothetical protein